VEPALRLAAVAGMAVAFLGCAVLAAWFFDIPVLKGLDPDWATMKPNTALSFLLAGSALWLLNPVEPAPARHLAGRLGAVVVAAIALLTIAAYAFDYDLGIDQLLFVDPTTTVYPGRPAPTTAGFFLLIAIALLLLRTSVSHIHAVVDLLAGTVVAGAYLAIIGYLYHAPALYTVPGYSSMALHTAIGHLLLGSGIFLAQPDRGLLRLIMSPRAAGATARRLLPVAILAPVLLGCLEAPAVKLGLLAPGAADLLLVVAFVAIFAATILWSVARVDKVDAERRRLELAGRHAEEEATHLSRIATLGELSGALAHELNQPLTAILSNAQTAQRLLQKTSVDLADLREILRDIVEDDKRASKVIDRLRGLFSKAAPHFESLDVNALIEELLQLTHSQLVTQHVKAVTQTTPGLPAVRGDRIQLGQVLLNLVVNGCEAMNSTNPVERELRISTRAGGDGLVQIEIADFGQGISPDVADRMFQPFFTDKKHGMGLGLSISRSIISAHGGRLWAANNRDRGTAFFIELPAFSLAKSGRA
jgi:signal transduction histidine kinase